MQIVRQNYKSQIEGAKKRIDQAKARALAGKLTPLNRKYVIGVADSARESMEQMYEFVAMFLGNSYATKKSVVQSCRRNVRVIQFHATKAEQDIKLFAKTDLKVSVMK